MEFVQPDVLGRRVISAAGDVSAVATRWVRNHRRQIEVAVGYAAYAAGAVALFKATTVTAIALGTAGVVGGGALVCRGLARPKA